MYLFFEKLQISGTFILDVLGILTFISPCLSVPLFLIVVIVFIVIIVIEGEISFSCSLFTV